MGMTLRLAGKFNDAERKRRRIGQFPGKLLLLHS